MEKYRPVVTTKAMQTQGPPLPDADLLKQRGARLLSFDGGGVKGVSSVIMLDAIMDKVKQIENSTGSDMSLETRKPVDYFDLAAGTSTGGLIALMLFRLRMDTKQCLGEYHGLAHDIFARTFMGSKFLGSVFGTLGLALKALVKGAEFAAEPLEMAIKKVVEKYTEADDPQRMQLVNQKSGMM